MKQRKLLLPCKFHSDNLKLHKPTVVLSLVFILLIVVTSCDTKTPMNFTLLHRQVINGVPSASGIVQLGNTLYVIGDNSAWLYQLNNQYEVTNQHSLVAGNTDSILPKATKPDFEAMTSIDIDGEMELLIFGSGSKSPERDGIVRVSFKDGIQTKLFDASTLYTDLRASTHLDAQSLNIEAAATIGNTLYLFNREHNLLLEYPLNEFLNFLNGLNELPSYNLYHINLPRYNGLDAKFSGASAMIGSQQLVFTASLEDTPNTYDDGEVIGSYVGIINLEYLKDGYQPQCILIADNSKPIAIKVESVEVLETINPNELKLVLVTDSDGGESELLVGSLTW